MVRSITYTVVVFLSLLLVWFAVADYRAARPLAEENLRGTALSIAAAVEALAHRDPTLRALVDYHPSDVAFYALIDRTGVYRFHSNTDLIGASTSETGFTERPGEAAIRERRVVLGTGEKAYEFLLPLRLSGEELHLLLTLHTYRADKVIRRARFTLIVLLSLLGSGLIMAAVIRRLALREQAQRRELARREGLARLGEMGALLAHEIRNPLAGIKGFAQWIERKPTNERNSEYACRIVAETRRLEALVNDLLSYARPEDGERSQVSVLEVMEHVRALVGSEAAQCGIDIEVSSGPDLEVPVNRDRLAQLLLNLCRNAIQSMPEGGELRMTAQRRKGEVEMQISDSGEGIPQELTGRIFEPFFTTRARGTGLGLALCRKITEEHGGAITVISAVGAGTIFTVALPVK